MHVFVPPSGPSAAHCTITTATTGVECRSADHSPRTPIRSNILREPSMQPAAIPAPEGVNEQVEPGTGSSNSTLGSICRHGYGDHPRCHHATGQPHMCIQSGIEQHTSEGFICQTRSRPSWHVVATAFGSSAHVAKARIISGCPETKGVQQRDCRSTCHSLAALVATTPSAMSSLKVAPRTEASKSTCMQQYVDTRSVLMENGIS